MGINACVYGLQKACGDLDFTITENELNFHCRSMFDMHRLEYDERIDREQFQEWAANDPSPSHFLQLFHTSQGLPDIYSEVQAKNNEQGLVFQMLASGKLTVSVSELANNPTFNRTLEDPTAEEVDVLISLMRIGENGENVDEVTDERFHTVLRTWNIFNVCDLDRSGTLDSKEMEILLWIQMRRKPSTEFVRDFVRSIDQNKDGDVSRAEWCEAVAGTMRRRSASGNTPPQEDSIETEVDEEEIKFQSEFQSERAPQPEDDPIASRRNSVRRASSMGMRAVPSESKKKMGKYKSGPYDGDDDLPVSPWQSEK